VVATRQALERPGERGGSEVDDGGEVAHRHGDVAMLLDGIEGGAELRHLRSGGLAPTRAKPDLVERRRIVDSRLEPSLTLRKTGGRNRLSFQLPEGYPRLVSSTSSGRTSDCLAANRSRTTAAYAKQAVRDKPIAHRQYVSEYGEDMKEIAGCRCGQGNGLAHQPPCRTE
jgi:hypothetical protein